MNSTTKDRIQWIDNAKAIGMFLVFYGHFIEFFWNKGDLTALYQQKFIYSFHMPFFFMLSGFFAKPPHNFYINFKRLFLRRLVPVFSFALLLLPLWILYIFIINGEANFSILLKNISGYFKGNPQLDLITWFLVCLFTCEVFASIVLPYLKSNLKILFFGVIILFVGLVICQKIKIVTEITGIAKNTWYIHEGIVALGFYLIGKAIYPMINYLANNKKWVVFLISAISFSVLIFTFNLNQPDKNYIVFMIESWHGNIFMFAITAIAGALFLIGIGIILPSSKPSIYVGQNTLILLGLNGIFWHFINERLVELVFPLDNWIFLTIYCSGISLCSILICYPIIQLINKYLPQLFGRSNLNGPIFPNLENILWREFILNKAQFIQEMIKKPFTYKGNKLR